MKMTKMRIRMMKGKTMRMRMSKRKSQRWLPQRQKERQKQKERKKLQNLSRRLFLLNPSLRKKNDLMSLTLSS